MLGITRRKLDRKGMHTGLADDFQRRLAGRPRRYDRPQRKACGESGKQ